jgi:hypothetical protein
MVPANRLNHVASHPDGVHDRVASTDPPAPFESQTIDGFRLNAVLDDQLNLTTG